MTRYQSKSGRGGWDGMVSFPIDSGLMASFRAYQSYEDVGQ